MKKILNTVLLVLDQEYTEDPMDHIQVKHLWLIGTQANLRIAAELRTRNIDCGLEKTISAFSHKEGTDPEEYCEGIFNVIDMHHGRYASIGLYEEFEVRGVALSESFQTLLESFGFRNFDILMNGFRASR